jgi:voltage-gated potassium channel Kch
MPLIRFLAVAVVALVALGLGFFGLRNYLAGQHHPASFGSGFWDIVFYDLQLPVLSSAPTQGAGPYPLQLGTARILAPLSTFLAAVGTLALLLGEQRRRLRAAIASRHAIVTGDAPLALELAGRLRGEKWTVIFVSSDDKTLTQARQVGVLGLQGSPTDATALRAAGIDRADRLYACAGNSIVNLNIATLAGQVLRRKTRPLAAYILVPNAELGVAFRAREMGVFSNSRLRPDFFAVENIAARRLFANGDYPLVQADGDGAHVVIIGFGLLGRAVLRETARRRAALGAGPPVEVAIRAATEADIAEVTAAFPLIGSSCHIVCGDAPVPAAAEGTVFICLEDYEKSLREGLDIARSTVGGRCRVVICVPESSLFVETLAAHGGLLDDGVGRLSVFEVLQEAAVSAIRGDDFAERLARSIHQAYVDAQKGKGATPATNPSMVPWDKLPEDLRRANIDQGADINTKLEAIGAFVQESGADARPGFFFSPPEIELLAQLEHERWFRERVSRGWTYGPKRDNDRKIHPDLVSWAVLPEGEREKDRDAIRAIPGILRDAGYQILRVPPDP